MNIKTFTGVCVFAVAMAALESAVVVYLRALYYPDGFTVAFRIVDEDVLKVELLRELATLLMLGSVGYLAGRSLNERLAYFFLSFAVWDLSYYGWLKLFIDWPASFLEWDILFLIPVTWLGPVLAPVICSLTMIVLAVVLVKHARTISGGIWLLLGFGSVTILFTFMSDYGNLILSHGFLRDYPMLLQNPEFVDAASRLVPGPYNWLMFGVGEMLICAGIYAHCRAFSYTTHFEAGMSGVTGKRSVD